MGASEIKAGGAHVEIGGKVSPLKAALNIAKKDMFAFANDARESIKSAAESMIGFGAKMAGFGALITAPLVASAKSVADYGENIGKLSSKTGMSAAALAGLKYAADSSGIGIGAVANAVKGMQRTIVGGSKESKAALEKLGTSAEELKSMTPEEQFGKLADAIGQVSDPAMRAAVAQQIFGKSALEIMPILEGGSAEIARMTREADTLGLVLGTEATAAANNLDTAFDRLEGGINGLRLQLGAAIAPILTEVVGKILDVVVVSKEWIQTNPEIIVSVGKIAAAISAAGLGFIALGTAIAAAMSPTVLITAGIAGIGAALLATTDTLGVTSTGFGELFNSIRIQGTGLGTWFAAFWIEMQQGWNTMTSNLQYSWEAAWLGIKTIARAGANLLLHVIEGIIRSIEAVADVANKVLPESMQINTRGIAATADSIKGVRKGMMQSQTADEKSLTNILYERDKKNAQLERRKQELFRTDPQDNTRGISIDTSRARAALETIGGNVLGSIDDIFNGIAGAIPATKFEEAAEKRDADVSLAATTKSEAASVGSFSGIAGSAIAASGIFNQQLQAQQEANSYLREIAQNTNGGAVGTFG